MLDWMDIGLKISENKRVTKDEAYQRYLDSPKHKGFSYAWKTLPDLKWTQYIDAKLMNRLDVELIADHFYRLGIKHGKRGMYGEAPEKRQGKEKEIN